MITDSRTFRKLYSLVWSGPRVAIYYAPTRELHACIVQGTEARFFYSIRACVDWAERNKIIRDAGSVCTDAEREADRLEQLDDEYTDLADEHRELNDVVAMIGNADVIAGTITRWRDRRWIGRLWRP